MAAQYGSMADMEDPGLKPSKPRGAVNIPALLFNLFIPPLLFLVLFGIITFSIHYQYPIFVWWIWSLIAFVPLFLAFRLAWRYRLRGPESLVPLQFLHSLRRHRPLRWAWERDLLDIDVPVLLHRGVEDRLQRQPGAAPRPGTYGC